MNKDGRLELRDSEISNFLIKASEFVSEARKSILKYWGDKSFSVIDKSDNSPLTQADLEAETILRTRISTHFSSHGIIGEEYEQKNPSSEFQWTIDPIDGTQNFAAGIPTFGTMVSLRFRNKPILGIIDHPAMNLTITSAYKQGTFSNGNKVYLKDDIRELTPNVIINTSTRGMFERTSEGYMLDNFMKKHPTTRIYYDCYGHTLSVLGSVAGMVEFNVRIWDASPTELLIEEAGGLFKYIRSEPLSEGKKIDTFISAIFGKPTVVNLLVKQFEKNSP